MSLLVCFADSLFTNSLTLGNIYAKTHVQPGWVEVTDVNIAAAAAAVGTPEALLYQSAKCLFSLILRPAADLRQKLVRWGPIRAYLVLNPVNMEIGKPSFLATQQKTISKQEWGYYWEKCK